MAYLISKNFTSLAFQITTLLRFYYKKKQLPQYFSTFKIIKKRDSHQRLTRNDKFLTNRVNHAFAENCVRYNLPKLLNETSSDILDKIFTHSELGLKVCMKKCFLNDYPDGCTLSSCGSCSFFFFFWLCPAFLEDDPQVSE